MGISQFLPVTGYIKMIDIWMIFTISYPFIVITLHCFQKVSGIIAFPAYASIFVKLRQGSGKDGQGMPIKAKGLKA